MHPPSPPIPVHGRGVRVLGVKGGWGGAVALFECSRTRKRSEAGCGRPEDGGVWTAKTVKRPLQQPAQPQYAKELSNIHHCSLGEWVDGTGVISLSAPELTLGRTWEGGGPVLMRG